MIENGTGVLYLGFPSCPWCRELTPYLFDLLAPIEQPLYYLNIQEMRDVRKLENGEIITTTAGTSEYHRLVELLYDWLDPYAGLEDETIKRIYAPTTIFVLDGEIQYVHMGTLDENSKNGYLELDEASAERMMGMLREGLILVYGTDGCKPVEEIEEDEMPC